MNKIFYVLLCLLPLNLAFVQNTTEDEVLDMEKSRFQAMINEDFDFLEKLIDDQLVYIHSNGNIDSKASFINAIREGKTSYDDIKLEESKVRIYDKTAIINGLCVFHQKNPDGSPRQTRLRYTNVYVKQKGNWKMVSWQSYKMS
ncbi:nuclear transport factor 2 family protein [Catalinimonas niigatensis]|uniref:nuclear transport factor 2 family protein n=1 Tax=Catalinimonas niigatensis TaxID=1397264 RepID=UPI0026658725|nr:nuclear transport factor 2 family protein [Catalinimonas niigatensis]WPP51470.1 nuclear transport factor 2 family protein [Catalinimonas niigatensis]